MSQPLRIEEHDVIMTVHDVAEYLKVARSTVYRLVRQDKLPGRKVGGTWRFSLRAIDAWIDNRQAGELPRARFTTQAPSSPGRMSATITPNDSITVPLAD